MKRLIVMSIAAILTVSAAVAQPRENNRRDGQKEKPTPEQMAEMRTERMAKHLSLSEEQQKEVLKLNLERITTQRASIEKNRKEAEKATAQRNAERAKYDEELKKVLTPEQYSTLEKNRASRMSENGRRHAHNMNGHQGHRPHGHAMSGKHNTCAKQGMRQGPGSENCGEYKNRECKCGNSNNAKTDGNK